LTTNCGCKNLCGVLKNVLSQLRNFCRRWTATQVSATTAVGVEATLSRTGEDHAKGTAELRRLGFEASAGDQHLVIRKEEDGSVTDLVYHHVDDVATLETPDEERPAISTSSPISCPISTSPSPSSPGIANHTSVPPPAVEPKVTAENFVRTDVYGPTRHVFSADSRMTDNFFMAIGNLQRQCFRCLPRDLLF
jgi:hypothetical protein